jgi:2-polyprenyl-6-methoxyphenol hydroxylase-like FAD-dependent oxidoreductase
MNQPDFDVVIVGYGPVSAALCIMLGRQGRRVAVFERWTERYTLPRAVALDAELYRVLAANGMREALPEVSHPGPAAYQWFNADWKELLRIPWAEESVSGGHDVNFIHQPTFEAMLDEQVRGQVSVELNLGWEALEVYQDADHAFLTAQNLQTGEHRRVSARYLIGCDGANSLVRGAIGGEQEDRGFEADWLVIDVLPNEGVALDIPPAGQWCNPARPTTIVPAGVKGGRFYRRWEFMRLPHETIDELENEAAAWRLLEPWLAPDQATLVRHKVYTFRSLLARKWRDGRLLIAGDAAHVMPPFMGQGMCSGLRDDWNLAWKLALILDGKAGPELLDSYQAERSPHVSDCIELSMFLGRVICLPDPLAAAERDAAFLSGLAPPPPPFPHLTAGLVHTSGDGDVAGLLSPHGKARCGAEEGPFDDLVGPGRFVLIARHADVLDQIPPSAAGALEALGAEVVALEGSDAGARVVTDVQGKYAAFLERHGVEAVLVRPDFYVYGGANAPASLARMIETLTASLHLR